MSATRLQLEAFFSHSLDGFFFMMLDEPVAWDETVDKECVLDYALTHQRVTEVNDAMLAQYQATREQFLGRSLGDFFAHDMAYGRSILRLLFDQGKLKIDTAERRFDGTSMWIEGEYLCIYDEQGRITGHFGIQREVTAQKQMEEEIRRLNAELEQRVVERTAQLMAVNKELEAFAYSISHDLRAPLRGINGFSQALVEDYGDVLDAEGRGYLRRVQAASRRMGQMIDDLLELSRLMRAEMRREVVSLSDIVQEIATDLSRTQPARQVNFIIKPDVATSGDVRLLRVVLEHLLGNAWKFTSKQDCATIEFGEMEVEEQVAYFVKDDGAGFDMTYADKLFGAFQRLHGTTEFAGTGIGLATVQRIVQRHNGRVWFEAEEGQGAVFYFTLGEQEWPECLSEDLKNCKR